MPARLPYPLTARRPSGAGRACAKPPAGLFAIAPGKHLFSRDCSLRRSLPSCTEGGRKMTAAARSGAAALPVRPGEKRWTEAATAKLRDELAAAAAELDAEIEREEVGL